MQVSRPQVRIPKGPVVCMPVGGAAGLSVELGNVCRIPKMILIWVHVADEVLSTAHGNHSNIAKRAAGSSNAAKKSAIIHNLRHPHTSPLGCRSREFVSEPRHLVNKLSVGKSQNSWCNFNPRYRNELFADVSDDN